MTVGHRRFGHSVESTLRSGQVALSPACKPASYRWSGEIEVISLLFTRTGYARSANYRSSQSGAFGGISLKQIAEAAGDVSPYHFARLFKQATGFSPYQFLIECCPIFISHNTERPQRPQRQKNLTQSRKVAKDYDEDSGGRSRSMLIRGVSRGINIFN
jgi:AraC-like DNA-binding protein